MNLLAISICPSHHIRLGIKVFFVSFRKLFQVTVKELWKVAAMEKEYIYLAKSMRVLELSKQLVPQVNNHV